MVRTPWCGAPPGKWVSRCWPPVEAVLPFSMCRWRGRAVPLLSGEGRQHRPSSACVGAAGETGRPRRFGETQPGHFLRVRSH